MRIAILADIHSNLEALDRALENIHEKAVDRVVCLGDIVGYGASPNECISRIQDITSHVLLGNHDQAAVDFSGAEKFNPYAFASARWTYEHLTVDSRDYLGNLPLSLNLDGLLFVHASPNKPEEWNYIISFEDAEESFDHFQEPICFVGHSHVPGIFAETGMVDREQNVERGRKYIINVGSVGQPRDGDWRLSLGFFDTEKWEYQNVRLEYNVDDASQKIMRAGLPRMLADRILVGR
jgi:diadenosine tetraphosphatase ApaH/serine/threonine PP2A family protein phosphatase